MKKKLLLISVSLFSIALAAQQVHPSMIGRGRSQRVELVKKQQKEKQDARETTKEELKNRVNNAIAKHKLERMRKAVETVNVNLLDEAVIEGSSKRTYTYSPEGKRDEEKAYGWSEGAWNLENTKKYDYRYDGLGRCISRTIYEDSDMPTDKVEISYQDGIRYFKYYEGVDRNYDGILELELSTEEGYDAQGREVMYKSYDDSENLEEWRELKYDADGKITFELYWQNNYGHKSETITDGLVVTDKGYECSSDPEIWLLSDEERTEMNQQGRKVFCESKEYDTENGTVQWGDRERNTYDSFQRVTSSIRESISDGEFVNTEKLEYTYWGDEYYGPKDEEELEGLDDFEGPILSAKRSEWKDNQWTIREDVNIERNADGIATEGTDVYYYIGSEAGIKETSVMAFDARGNVLSVVTTATNLGVFLGQEKEEYQYDDQNRLLKTSYFDFYNDEWSLTDEEGQAFDTQGRITLTYSRRNGGGGWSGGKTETTYTGNITETADYDINYNDGTFKSTPTSYNSEGLLPNGLQQYIHKSYDESGNVTEGSKSETGNFNKKIVFPYPESYDDGVDLNLNSPSMDMSYNKIWRWESNDWALQDEYGMKEEGDSIVYVRTSDGHIMNKDVYFIDGQNRLTAYKFFGQGSEGLELDTQTIYTYNSDGLLTQKNEDGTITTYIYSKHPVTGVEENTVSLIKVDGRTVTTGNSEAALKAYSITGTLVATGNGTITLPESGIYIIVTDSVHQKIAVK